MSCRMLASAAPWRCIREPTQWRYRRQRVRSPPSYRPGRRCVRAKGGIAIIPPTNPTMMPQTNITAIDTGWTPYSNSPATTNQIAPHTTHIALITHFGARLRMRIKVGTPIAAQMINAAIQLVIGWLRGRPLAASSRRPPALARPRRDAALRRGHPDEWEPARSISPQRRPR